LETTAEQLISSLTVPNVATAVSTDWVRALTIVADPRLDAVSETAWYLAASPNQIETIVRAYLAGQDRIHSEEDIHFETDGMRVKARMDIAVAAADWRGLVKNAGA
jgi:hypothetical protein